MHIVYTQASEAAKAACAPFTWVDGPLVTAMRRGDMILIDEINLAEDAVLERLNRWVGGVGGGRGGCQSNVEVEPHRSQKFWGCESTVQQLPPVSIPWRKQSLSNAVMRVSGQRCFMSVYATDYVLCVPPPNPLCAVCWSQGVP
jgi:hypothetical protein